MDCDRIKKSLGQIGKFLICSGDFLQLPHDEWEVTESLRNMYDFIRILH